MIIIIVILSSSWRKGRRRESEVSGLEFLLSFFSSMFLNEVKASLELRLSRHFKGCDAERVHGVPCNQDEPKTYTMPCDVKKVRNATTILYPLWNESSSCWLNRVWTNQRAVWTWHYSPAFRLSVCDNVDLCWQHLSQGVSILFYLLFVSLVLNFDIWFYHSLSNNAL